MGNALKKSGFFTTVGDRPLLDFAPGRVATDRRQCAPALRTRRAGLVCNLREKV
jgi:hypothetical protein